MYAIPVPNVGLTLYLSQMMISWWEITKMFRG